MLADFYILDVSLIVIDLFSLGLAENQDLEGAIVFNAVVNVDGLL